jgi:hypothetical protein
MRLLTRTPIAALVLLLAVAGGGAGAEPVVRASASRVTLDVRDLPRAELLRALAAASGFELRGTVEDDAPVTVRVDDEPLPDALRRVLGEQSFLVSYGAGGAPRVVELLGASGERVVATSASAPAEPSAEAPARVSNEAGGAPPLPGSRRPHPVNGRVAGALGKQEASFDELVALAARTDDAALRRAAVEQGLAVLQAEPELREAVLATVNRAPPQILARYVVVAAGPRAEALAASIAEAIGPRGRDKAAAVIRAVRATAEP